MPTRYQFLRSGETGGVILNGDSPIARGVYFEIAQLNAKTQRTYSTADREMVFTVLSGVIEVVADSERFAGVGGRVDVWSGMPDSVYVGSGRSVTVTALSDWAEVAVAAGVSRAGYAPFRVPPDQVEVVEVGSSATHSYRKLCHILGKRQDGAVDRLIVSERFTEGGCWAGFPPHTHGTAGPEESAHDEVYHYRYQPANGFGGQYWFDQQGNSEVFMTRTGDTFLFSDGYHPTVVSPGHTEYCFTILSGRDQRSLVQNFMPEYRYMMDRFPGIGTMIARYK